MPDSQENNYPLHIDIVASSDSWDEVIANFRQAADVFGDIGPVVLEANHSVEDMIESLSEMIDIRHGEYPCRDGYGDYWYDPSGIHSANTGVCFICKQTTNRLDIDLHGFFCNSADCNNKVREDLESR